MAQTKTVWSTHGPHSNMCHACSSLEIRFSFTQTQSIPRCPTSLTGIDGPSFQPTWFSFHYARRRHAKRAARDTSATDHNAAAADAMASAMRRTHSSSLQSRLSALDPVAKAAYLQERTRVVGPFEPEGIVQRMRYADSFLKWSQAQGITHQFVNRSSRRIDARLERLT